jgi:transposase
MIMARRFRFAAIFCGQRILSERFSGDVLPSRARRTGRLDCLIHHLGPALGGRPATSFTGRLAVRVDNDTLLRVVRRHVHVFAAPFCIIAIDDRAWRRNHRYGKVVCDLEWRRPMILLPVREPATAETWLAGKPGTAIVARDRSGGYGETVAKAPPNAIQIADRRGCPEEC